jgi:hypothetical protein
MDKPAAANFEMRGLTVSGFQSGGVQINPLTAAPTKEDPHTWDGGNTAAIAGAILEGNRFEDLGSLHSKQKDVSWAKQQYGIGGIELHGVSDSLIKDNVFDDLENGKVAGAINKGKPKGQEMDNGEHLLHAIYVRDQSSGNRIEGNRFTDVSGDAIRFSNGSNDNTVVGNSSREPARVRSSPSSTTRRQASATARGTPSRTTPRAASTRAGASAGRPARRSSTTRPSATGSGRSSRRSSR